MGSWSTRCARLDQSHGHSRWELATIQRDADALLRWVAFVSLRLYSLFLLTVWLVDAGVGEVDLAICRKCILRFEVKAQFIFDNAKKKLEDSLIYLSCFPQ